jgi:uncharacterized protein YjiS (DUF1127 family)
MSMNTPIDPPPKAAERIGFLGAIRKAIAAVREGIELATRYRILHNLSNEELAALGITRKDIPTVVVLGWSKCSENSCG